MIHVVSLNSVRRFDPGFRKVRRKFEKNWSKNRLARTPDLETPSYSVLESSATWEVRRYDDFAVCSTAMASGTSAFQSLAGYIFGKNAGAERMAMTTPVITGADERMSFVMPSQSLA